MLNASIQLQCVKVDFWFMYAQLNGSAEQGILSFEFSHGVDCSDCGFQGWPWRWRNHIPPKCWNPHTCHNPEHHNLKELSYLNFNSTNTELIKVMTESCQFQFLWFYVFMGNLHSETNIRTWPLPSKSFAIHYDSLPSYHWTLYSLSYRQHE